MPRILLVLMLLSVAAPASAQSRGSGASVRREVVREIAHARDQEHRRLYRVSVDASPGALPSDFEVTYHGSYVRVESAATISVSCTAVSCESEWLRADGLFRAAVDRRSAEQLAYQTFFWTHANQAQQPGINEGGSVSHFSSHTPLTRIEYRSGDTVWQTERAQPNSDTIHGHETVTAFGHWALTQAVEEFAESHIAQQVPRSPALDREMRAELARIADLGEQATDRQKTRALLLGHHLSAWGDRSLVPLLRRANLTNQAEVLALRTSDDPVADVSRAICAAESQTYYRAFEVAATLGETGQRAIRRALHCVSDGYAAAKLLKGLGHEGLVRRDYLRIRRLLGHAVPEVQAEAARLLLQSRSRTLALTRLRHFAFMPIGQGLAGARPVDERMPAEQRIAISALVADATTSEQKREIGDRLAPLLRNLPLTAHATYSGMDFLVGVLAGIDAGRYLTEFERLLTHNDSSVIVTLVLAIADSDQTRGVQEARRRIRMFADGDDDASYRWDVLPYHELLMAASARDALPDLRRAGRELREPGRVAGFLPDHRAFVAALRSAAPVE